MLICYHDEVTILCAILMFYARLIMSTRRHYYVVYAARYSLIYTCRGWRAADTLLWHYYVVIAGLSVIEWMLRALLCRHDTRCP